MAPAQGWPLAALALLAAACSPEEDNAGDPDRAGKREEERIPCALDGAMEFKPVCLMEREQQGDTLFVVVRHPDGGFRRFEALEDGRGVAVADGADDGRIEVEPGHLTITVARDRYRFPAMLKGNGEKPGNVTGE